MGSTLDNHPAICESDGSVPAAQSLKSQSDYSACVAALTMRLSAHLRQRLTDRLNECRLVILYDGERAFGDFVSGFQAPHCRVVSAAESALVARRKAEVIYQGMNEAGHPDANANLLIYIPRARAPQEQRTQDPFEIFAAAGTVFGEAESERLQSLAHAAMPELIEQIDGLFLSGQPAFELLDRLKQTTAYPLIKQALGTQSVVEACAPGRRFDGG